SSSPLCWSWKWWTHRRRAWTSCRTSSLILPAANTRLRPGTSGKGRAASAAKRATARRPKAGARKTVPRPAESLLPPPEPEDAIIGESTDGPTGPDGPPGDPNGTGDKPNGDPRSSCPDCPDGGPGGPGGP